MPLRLKSHEKIRKFFSDIHSFGYYKGWDSDSGKYLEFSKLPKNQQIRIIKANKKIFEKPEYHTYLDFIEIQLIYLGDNLLE